MQREILKIEDLSLGYLPERVLLDRISAGAIQGEIVALVGRNGTGKSTLLRTIAGRQLQIGGEIYLQNREIKNYTPTELARLLTFAGTGNQFIQNLTVYELVSMGRHPYTNWWGRLQEKDHTRIRESIRFVGMESFADARLEQLSDGERQRAIIAMALSQETSVIVLDEPTAYLDIPNRIAIMEVLLKMKHSGHTVIFSTHDFDNVFSYADKLWIIKDNSLRQGAPEDLGMREAFSDLFGDSGINFSKEQLGFFRSREGMRPVCLHPVEDKSIQFWTERALVRKGFRIVSKPEPGSPEVRVTNENGVYCWELRHESNIETFQSLYELNNSLTVVP